VRSIFRKTLFENFIVFACEQGFPAPGGEVILNSRPTKMAERATDQEFVEFVVKQIVNNPD